MGLLTRDETSSFWKVAAVAAGAVGIATLLWPTSASAESPPDGEPETVEDTEMVDVETFNRQRLDRNRRAMNVLLGWSIVNIGAGTAGALLTDGAESHFHEMNAAWNVVNAVIALVGRRGAATEDPTEGGGLDALNAAHGTEKVFLLNIGLNVSYIAAGGYLRERGIRTDSDRLRGWGPSVMIQGAFLLAFDSTMYALTRRHRRQYEIQLAPQLDRPGITAQFQF